MKKFTTKTEIINWLTQMNISNYVIRDDLIVDVNGDVNLFKKHLKYLPIQFGKVSDTFDISQNELVTLKGSPTEVGDEFYCNDNQLISLKEGPKIVGSCYCAQANRLTSLEGLPNIIHDDLTAWENQINTIEYFPSQVQGSFDISMNQLASLNGINTQIGTSFDCSHNPIENIDYLDIKSLEVSTLILPEKFKDELAHLSETNPSYSFLKVKFSLLKDYQKTLFEKKQLESMMLNTTIKSEKKFKV